MNTSRRGFLKGLGAVLGGAAVAKTATAVEAKASELVTAMQAVEETPVVEAIEELSPVDHVKTLSIADLETLRDIAEASVVESYKKTRFQKMVESTPIYPSEREELAKRQFWAQELVDAHTIPETPDVMRRAWNPNDRSWIYDDYGQKWRHR